MNYIFDLDGTIIDSRDSIKAALAHALLENGFSDVAIPDATIGPPIMQAIRSLLPSVGDNKIQMIVADFCAIYDRDFCLAYSMIPEAVSLIHELTADDRAFIVTNKRYFPAYQIFESDVFFERFEEKVCVDSIGYENLTKSERICRLMTMSRLSVSESLYIGDHFEDETAASGAGIAFLKAW